MRVIQRYNRKICFTEFFDLYRLEIKLCLIIKTLGVTGACPRSAFRQPPPTYRSFSLQSFNHSGICTIGRSIAAVCVKIRNVDFDVLDSTTLPISGFNVAMCGDDEVARNRFNALLRKEMEVQGQRSGGRSALSVKVASDTPDVGEHFSDERRAPSTG